MMIFCRLLFGSEIFTLYKFFLNSFATCNPVSRLINLSFEIPPDIIKIFFFNLFYYFNFCFKLDPSFFENTIRYKFNQIFHIFKFGITFVYKKLQCFSEIDASPNDFSSGTDSLINCQTFLSVWLIGFLNVLPLVFILVG